MRNNPGRLIADIFVPTGDIGGRGREKEREGQGGRLQGPARVGGGNKRGGGKEQGSMGKAARRGRDGAEDDCEWDDNGGGGAQATGSRQTGEKRQRQG